MPLKPKSSIPITIKMRSYLQESSVSGVEFFHDDNTGVEAVIEEMDTDNTLVHKSSQVLGRLALSTESK